MFCAGVRAALRDELALHGGVVVADDCDGDAWRGGVTSAPAPGDGTPSAVVARTLAPRVCAAARGGVRGLSVAVAVAAGAATGREAAPRTPLPPVLCRRAGLGRVAGMRGWLTRPIGRPAPAAAPPVLVAARVVRRRAAALLAAGTVGCRLGGDFRTPRPGAELGCRTRLVAVAVLPVALRRAAGLGSLAVEAWTPAPRLVLADATS